jgi:predicted AAA+ superfamily ATPase
MIYRKISEIINQRLFKGKAIILTGARQVGKTTLAKYLAENAGLDFIYLNCDEPDIRELLERPTSTQLKQLTGKNKLIIIDEAQRIKDFGLTAKLIIDNLTDVQLLLTGSSSLDLTARMNEPLTGRKFEFCLYPISFGEMAGYSSLIDEKRLLGQRMRFGYYPDIINNPTMEDELLLELTSSYLFKDILSLGQIKKPDILEKLLKALALQIGSEVSVNELSRSLGIDKNTVARYIELLEKSYVIFSLGSFSRNLRNELKKSRKIFFWDLGVRNAVIKNFQPMELRPDKGALWENFIIAERLKFLNNTGRKPNVYFWRTVQMKEIDFIEEYGGKLEAIEIKWSPTAKTKKPLTFLEAYPGATYKLINNSNFEHYLFDLP